LKGGIITADAVNTVSPNYAKEIQTEEQGKGLHGVLLSQRHKLSGILNGINMRTWDPAIDALLPANYSVRSLSGKAKCKKALQQEFGLPTRADTLLLGVVSRLDVQKGIDLIATTFPLVASLDLQLVVLGAGADDLEAAMRQQAEAYPQQVGVRIGYDEKLAHLIEAGADAFLMPSAYEPCGLNQMYSQRYGTLPIVRETGGLKDTVQNTTPKRIASGEACGFTFRPYDPLKLADAIRHAARMFHNDRKTWRLLMQHVMRRDFSWERSAQAYMRIYDQLARHSRSEKQEVLHG
jgi:starch synthase